MAKAQINASCPSNVENGVDEYQQENNLDSRSESARQLIERGLEDWRSEEPPGLWLVRQASGIAAVATLLLLIVSLNMPYLFGSAVSMGVVTSVFASIWAAILILDQ